jgi:polysaccharide export outer membrane protein
MASEEQTVLKHQSSVAVWIMLTALLSYGSQAAAQGGSPAATSPPAGGRAPALASVPPNYVIGANDRLRITVWNQENISGEYAVSGDGSFTFPLIGRVAAGGLTLVKLEAELKRLLAAGYFKNPQVTAAVLEYRSKQIFVMGALRSPGAYPLTGDMTLVEVLARAGSTTADAADHAFIIRSANAEGPVLPGQDESASVTRIDLREFNDGQLSTVVMVHDGDTIFIPRASTVYVYGQVRNPGVFSIGQETTVRQALSLAGGVSEFGAANRVKVLRVENGKEREIKVELNDLVKPGDTIVVPERYF